MREKWLLRADGIRTKLEQARFHLRKMESFEFARATLAREYLNYICMATEEGPLEARLRPVPGLRESMTKRRVLRRARRSLVQAA